MQRLAMLAVLLLALPVSAWAAPEVGSLVEKAITALKTRSYEARLRFINHYDGGKSQEVRIYHVAPDLYRVEPLQNGQPITYHFIENAEELVKVTGASVEVMPQQRFAVTDALTAKFLRDLGTYSGTTLLDGEFLDQPIYVLRQDLSKDKPYTITVGLLKENAFPLFLQVVDAAGNVRVHNQFDYIKFLRPQDIPDSRFQVPEQLVREQGRAPRVQQAESFAMPVPAPAPSRAGSGAAARKSLYEDLPLYPKWLPEGYSLEAISVLDYGNTATPALVYQLEIYGPQLEDVLSIFQMQCDELGDCDLSKALGSDRGGYLLRKQDKWVVAAFGDLPQADLLKLLDNLDHSNSETILRLLLLTRQRDEMMDRATEYR